MFLIKKVVLARQLALSIFPAALAMKGFKTLLIDLDPQSNSTSGLGIYGGDRLTTYDILFDASNIHSAIIESDYPSLSIITSCQDLSGAEVELVNEYGREYRLKDAISEIEGKFDYIVIDTPPTLGLLTVNALSCSNGVLIPTQSEYYALEGLSQLLKTINLIKKRLNPDLEINGLLVTMFDRRNKLSKFVDKEVRDFFGDKVYKTVIPRNVRLSEAPSHGVPCVFYDAKSSGARSYIKFSEEFISNSINIKSENNHELRL